MEDKYVVIYWRYGNHADDFIIDRVVGLYTFDEASDIVFSYGGSEYITLAEYKDKEAKNDN